MNNRKEVFNYLKIGEVKPKGWIYEQMNRDLTIGFAGHLDEITDRVSRKIFVNRVNSYLQDPNNMDDVPNSWWDGESEANWLFGFVCMAFLTQNINCMQKAEKLLEEILDSACGDGYIGIYKPNTRYAHTSDNGELWCQSRIMLAMLAYYEISGKTKYLKAVEKAVKLTIEHYGKSKSYFDDPKASGGAGGLTHGLMIVDVMEWLYNITGDEDYKGFGIWCYDDYSKARINRDSDNQLKKLLDHNRPLYGHAPHVVEHMRVPLWAYYVSNDLSYKKASESIYKKIKQYIGLSGACIGDEQIKNRKPLPDMTYEYCAITDLMLSFQSALQKTTEAEYGDMIENMVFNAAQAARLPDGSAISYLSRDNRYFASKKSLFGNDSRFKYSPAHEDAAVCCNPNAVKLMPLYTSKMWMRCENGLAAVTYGPSEVDTMLGDIRVVIKEETAYPFEDSATFTLQPAVECDFVLKLRIPGWAGGVSLNAGDAEIDFSGGYISIRKKWQTEDKVLLRFNPEIKLIRAENGEMAIRRGALLYALRIPHKRYIIKKYGTEGFADIDYEPDGAIIQTPAIYTASDNDTGLFEYCFAEKADILFPWDDTPSVIKAVFNKNQTAKLVPIGTTILRRVTFPLVEI